MCGKRFHHVHHHLRGAADVRTIDRRNVDPSCEESIAFRAIDAAGKRRDLLRLAAHHEHERETREVAIFEGEQFFAKHHARRRSIAVDERYAASRLRREHVADDRKDRRDAASSCDVKRVSRGDGIWRGAETTIGRRCENRRTRHERDVRPRREHAARNAFDADAEIVTW